MLVPDVWVQTRWPDGWPPAEHLPDLVAGMTDRLVALGGDLSRATWLVHRDSYPSGGSMVTVMAPEAHNA